MVGPPRQSHMGNQPGGSFPFDADARGTQLTIQVLRQGVQLGRHASTANPEDTPAPPEAKTIQAKLESIGARGLPDVAQHFQLRGRH